MLIYRQRYGTNDTGGLRAFPPGFNMVAGYPLFRSYTDTPRQQAITYACLQGEGAPAVPQTNGFPTRNCPAGIRTQVYFPSCWNGTLASPDQTHVAYPDGVDHGNCPESHPIRLISIFFEAIWNTPDFADMWYGDEQPFVWSYGDPTGYGYHGGFFSGWDVNILQPAIDRKCRSSLQHPHGSF